MVLRVPVVAEPRLEARTLTLSRHSFHVYQVPGGKKGWRWRLYGVGGHLVAVSGDGFADEAACRAATHALTEQAAGAKYARAV